MEISNTSNSLGDITVVENKSNMEGLDVYPTMKNDVVDEDGDGVEANKECVVDEVDEEPIDMSFPSGGDWKKILLYLISFPIMCPLYYTLPDTKKPKSMLACNN